MEEMMLQLNEFSHNHNPFGVKMLAKYIRRGISVQRLFEYGEQLGYYQILKGSLITFTEKLTHNLKFGDIHENKNENNGHNEISTSIHLNYLGADHQ
jgi:hypothetical protein